MQMAPYLILFFSAFISSIYSWCDAGHMIVAEIASRQLTPQAQQEINKLNCLIEKKYPRFANIHNAATYPDKISSSSDFISWEVLHFTNIPYDPESILTEEKRAEIAKQIEKDVIYGILESTRCLKDQNISDLDRWCRYAYLLHFVADIHQPLHCSSRYSCEHPEGDRGGNLFFLPGHKNLHAFWDEGLGILRPIQEIPAYKDHLYILTKASQLMVKYPPDFFAAITEKNPRQWAIESADYAASFAFQLKENQLPSQNYIDQGQIICEQRLTLAGYRLGELLNEIFDQKNRSD